MNRAGAAVVDGPGAAGPIGAVGGSSFLWLTAFPLSRTLSGSFGKDQCFRLAAEDVRFQPIVQVQPELLFGTGRHPITKLIEPCLGFGQPTP